MLSDFGDIPTVLLRFAFDFPPIIGEVNIKAAPSSWLIVSTAKQRDSRSMLLKQSKIY